MDTKNFLSALSGLSMSDKIKLREHPDFFHGFHGYPSFTEMVKNGTIKLPTPEEMIEVNGNKPQLDICSVDCSNMDLSGYDNDKIAFDEKTVFPSDKSQMPKDFEPSEIMERHKNPGLGIRNLHEKGWTGKGLSVAIIDDLLAPHQEYNDNLVSYKEFGHKGALFGEMHGSAVSSILVGKTCGVAPDAKLYYYAATNIRRENGKNITYSTDYAKALNDILDLNQKLPEDEKIQAVSVSWGSMFGVEGKEDWQKAFERAKKEGLPVITTVLKETYDLSLAGLGRKNNADPDDISSYQKASFPQALGKQAVDETCLAVPMDNRTRACPQSQNGYTHDYHGGWSWRTPFYTGLFLLAKQADRSITLEEFHKKALQTGVYKEGLGVIAQPEKMIETILKEKQFQQQAILAKLKKQNG